ncbi:unnamed protein product, partial [Gongylonema pulchrum]|uniref:Uncharacterized protein n=1 Tax=Gongylonema pulchrum TaxID=637853 RepID=A0A183DJT4_9BILA
MQLAIKTLWLQGKPMNYKCFSCPNFTRRWTFCEFATNRLSPELGKRPRTKSSTTLGEHEGSQRHQHQQQPAAKLPHLLVYVGQTTPPGSFTPVLVPHLLHDNSESAESHDARKKREHTPPQAVCE